jgi:hypothetical protein
MTNPQTPGSAAGPPRAPTPAGERSIADLFGMLGGMRRTLRGHQQAVRETKRAIAEMEAEIVRRCAAEQEQRREGSEEDASA